MHRDHLTHGVGFIAEFVLSIFVLLILL